LFLISRLSPVAFFLDLFPLFCLVTNLYLRPFSRQSRYPEVESLRVVVEYAKTENMSFRIVEDGTTENLRKREI